MLTARQNLRGMTLVEIMITIVIIAILYAAAAPSFSEWVQNTRIRTAAESIQNGLSLAKSEAVHRNTTAQFVSCGGSSWDVIVASSVAASSTVCSSSANPGWISMQSRYVQASSTTDLVDITQAALTVGFNGLGRQISVTNPINGATTPNPPTAIDINVSSSSTGTSCFCPAGTCGYPGPISYSNTGKLRCLRISISPGGLVRMCDPALATNSPQGC